MNNNKMERFNGEVRDREKGYERAKERGHANSQGLSSVPQLHKITRRTKRQDSSRSLRNRDRRRKQVDDNNTKCEKTEPVEPDFGRATKRLGHRSGMNLCLIILEMFSHSDSVTAKLVP